MQLFPFQIEASTKIAERFGTYAADPLFTTRTRSVPFYQNLNSLTGSGKTLILADAVSQIRSQLGAEPIVLWLSKGKVVVWQTLTNLASGKYAELVGSFLVKPLMDCRQRDIESPLGGLILVATVGKFNQADQEKGDRRVYNASLDLGDASLWEMLKKRRDTQGRRRPFIVVYDEGHNLSDQQTQLLLDLEPDALIAASATVRVPPELGRVITRLKDDKGWRDDDLVTTVKSGDVVRSGLVKQQIMLGGYVTPMEIAVDDLLDSMGKAEAAASASSMPFRPKAIYVSNTNVVSGKADNTSLRFEEREARPIQIWRHLVKRGIDPATIAVYCNLKFEAKAPPPTQFNLFNGGDNDYDRFISGDFQHIIFNQTLQEGWDDPACYFAYVDKDMGSRDQVTQIVGRVLRQPQATHYPDPILNTAHFYVRTDEKAVFDQVLKDVRAKIGQDAPEITLTIFKGGKDSAKKLTMPAKRVKQLPELSIKALDAMAPIKKILTNVQDYRGDNPNTVGSGTRIQMLQTVGSEENSQEEWIEVAHSNRVTARWVFVREIEKSYRRAINLCDIEDPKFDALIEYNSPAAEQIRDAARKVVEAYIQHSFVIHNFAGAYEVPGITINPDESTGFTFAVHDRYSGLNDFEREFAKALDKTQRIWFRNPSRGCFEVPLLSNGATKNFNPDFVVWIGDQAIAAIDTKGDHLIVEDAGRKLFHINKVGTGPELFIRLITQGTWSAAFEKQNANGFTVWTLRNGKAHPLHADDAAGAVDHCLKQT
ncbi:hypothetical protein EXN32_25525 [Agrobacterium tumefaciens]|uniref:DEAD/DEAH box helicase family protein n=1 Tax=Agrobacterium TaxID=357 RepID=UPI00115C90D7|nr:MULTISPECIES: DEAD/DEAH box helicase family protein [Agrobacterium]MDA5240520.1 DEAD/DEAH box helicase family protein [Agrobacterium sp. MAFF310724]MDA5250257.1 DEAD/DEAH box helicase family protein [Agrobacterium sp. MAFF210268]TRB09712.1 hypothetical protein EXN32_25525 [Agrobacterium tumefaciens]